MDEQTEAATPTTSPVTTTDYKSILAEAQRKVDETVQAAKDERAACLKRVGELDLVIPKEKKARGAKAAVEAATEPGAGSKKSTRRSGLPEKK